MSICLAYYPIARSHIMCPGCLQSFWIVVLMFLIYNIRLNHSLPKFVESLTENAGMEHCNTVVFGSGLKPRDLNLHFMACVLSVPYLYLLPYFYLASPSSNTSTLVSTEKGVKTVCNLQVSTCTCVSCCNDWLTGKLNYFSHLAQERSCLVPLWLCNTAECWLSEKLLWPYRWM